MWEFLTSPDGPWWGDAVVAGGFLLIGALISLASAWFVDWRSSKRTLALRWDEHIREQAVEFLRHADKFAESKELGKPPDTGDDTAQRAIDSLNALSFVAPEDVTAAATTMLVWVSSLDGSGSQENLTNSFNFNKARQKFIEEVRKAVKAPQEPKKFFNSRRFWTKKGPKKSAL